MENIYAIAWSVSVFVTLGHDGRAVGYGRKRRKEAEMIGMMAYCLCRRRNQSVC